MSKWKVIFLKGTVIGIFLAAAALTLVAYITGGFPAVLDGLVRAKASAWQALPLLLAAFAVIGQLQILLSQETVKKWLEKNSGNKGIIYSSMAGGLFPGGPYIFYPFLAGFWKKEIPFYLLYSFIHGKMLYDFSRLPLEAGLINPWVALLRNLITLPVPVFMGWLARRFPPGKASLTPTREVRDDASVDRHI
jgi:uncharacterized protein